MPHHAARITAGELVLVCSHYDLGAIESVRRFKGGSRSSPKVLLIAGGEGGARRGAYLLKRRPPGGADQAARVALSHDMLRFLEARAFPVPRLVGTRRDGSTLLEVGGRFYEMFRFVPGRPYERTPGEAAEAGRVLAACHAALRDFPRAAELPVGTFHNHPAAADRIRELPAKLPDPRIRQIAPELAAMYLDAARNAEAAGVASMSSQPIHADWHPGNVLYEAAPKGTDAAAAPSERMVGVLDFDSARLAPTVLDLANGAIQFAVGRKLLALDDSDPGAGAELLRVSLSPDLLSAFVRGYRAAGGAAGAPEVQAIPWLMVQALIVEAVAPIAATGTFGKVDPVSVLSTVHKTTGWISSNAARLVELTAGQ